MVTSAYELYTTALCVKATPTIN